MPMTATLTRSFAPAQVFDVPHKSGAADYRKGMGASPAGSGGRSIRCSGRPTARLDGAIRVKLSFVAPKDQEGI